MLGLGIVLFFVLVALLAPLVANHDPFQTSFTTIRKAPSVSYWLGTDELGRDIFSRMVYGARASLMAGLVSVLIALVVGVPFGLAAGYFGGWTDSCISRATEALLAIPFLILAIALAAFLGPSLTNAMIAIGVSAAPSSSGSRAGRCWRSRARTTCRAPARWAPRTCASSAATSSRTSCRR